MSDNHASDVNRREFLAIAAAAQGALILGLWVPQRANAHRFRDARDQRAGSSPDDTVTIRIAQTELGQESGLPR
jgi:hypothetical protein